MRFTAALALGAAVVVSAQSATSSAWAANPSQEACLKGCGTDVTCQAHCIAVPSPNDDQANQTTQCAMKCDQGSGSPEDTQKYAECVQKCITDYYYNKESGTPNNGGSGNAGSGSATATSSAANPSATPGSGSGSGSGSSAQSGSASSTGSSGGSGGSGSGSNSASSSGAAATQSASKTEGSSGSGSQTSASASATPTNGAAGLAAGSFLGLVAAVLAL